MAEWMNQRMEFGAGTEDSHEELLANLQDDIAKFLADGNKIEELPYLGEEFEQEVGRWVMMGGADAVANITELCRQAERFDNFEDVDE